LLTHRGIGYQSFDKFDRCGSPSQKYEALKVIKDDPDFFLKNPSIFKFMVNRYRRSFKDLNLESERLESIELAKSYMLRMVGSLDETNF
jgi:hypothetical protein